MWGFVPSARSGAGIGGGHGSEEGAGVGEPEERGRGEGAERRKQGGRERRAGGRAVPGGVALVGSSWPRGPFLLSIPP